MAGSKSVGKKQESIQNESFYLIMEKPKEALIRHKRHTKPPQTTSNAAICPPFLKQVLLHDWWLTKADASGFHGKRLAVGGFTSKERQGIRSFCSGPIVVRNDAVTLRTIDGITVLLHGLLNRSRTLENGFSHEVCEHFHIGFPYYWEEFGAISVVEDAAQFSFSDSHKTSCPGDNGTNMSCGNIFDEILRKNHVGACEVKENTPMTGSMNSTSEQKIKDNAVVGGVERSGPLTRSRARLFQTR